MKPLRAAGALAFFLVAAIAHSAPDVVSLDSVIDDDLRFATAQYDHLLRAIEGRKGLPRAFEKNAVTVTPIDGWTSGFFPGALWYLFEATKDEHWRTAAERYTALLEPVKDNRRTHDVGFILYCSYGNGLRLTGNPQYRDVLLAGAKSLSTRFNPHVAAVKSWDKSRWEFPVIIDNMMNLELLLWASKSGEPRLGEVAVAHADTTLRNHFRPDGSSYHVLDYNATTGAVKSKGTHQGAADTSTWARGEAWALYGYTMMFRETRKPEYLAQARKVARFVQHHPRLPADKIPYWDFDAADIPRAPRDASAAALMSSALLELATYVEPAEATEFRGLALAQLRSLSSPAYRAPLGGQGGFLLMHSTGNYPQHGEVDVPIIYADYYWLEALLRARALPAAAREG